MKAIVLGLVATMAGVTAGASTKADFYRGDVAIHIRGNSKDTDAAALFKAVNSPATEDTTVLKKEFTVLSADKQRVFEMRCETSKELDGDGSCLLLIPRSSFTRMDAGQREVVMDINDMINAGTAAAFFVEPTGTDKVIFRSGDNHLQISRLNDPTGRALGFAMKYKE